LLPLYGNIWDTKKFIIRIFHSSFSIFEEYQPPKDFNLKILVSLCEKNFHKIQKTARKANFIQDRRGLTKEDETNIKSNINKRTIT